MTNVVLFKFIYFFQIIGIFISFYYYFLVSTFSGTHVRTVRTGSYASGIVAFGNCLYILGGGNSNKAGRFDTAESKWEKIASMPISELSPCGVATQEKIFVTSARCQQCEVYQVSTNEWHTIPSLNFTRPVVSCSLVCLNETVYVVGVASQPAEIVVNSYNPKLNKWIQKTSIPINKSSDEQTYSFQCSTLKLSKGLLTKPKIVTIG